MAKDYVKALEKSPPFSNIDEVNILSWFDLARAGIASWFCLKFAAGAYRFLERYPKWRPSWKRWMAISPILIAELFMLSGLAAVYSKYGFVH